jgi:hypothetical protein
MSRIREKLSKIFASQIPEFIRVGEYNVVNVQPISTTASSKIVTVGDTNDIIAGDKLQHPAITNTVFVTKVLSSTKVEVSNAIVVTLSNQNAKFIRADSTSTFVKFLEAYYKFLEQDKGAQEVLQNARKYGDSDYTSDDLIEQFFVNYGNDIPRNIVTDKRTFIKHFRDIYKTKGTEEAYKLLFRAMFNSKAEFYYPSESVLKPSDGVWKKDRTMKVIAGQAGSDNPFDFKNTKITGQTSKATAVVDNVLKLFEGSIEIYELYLENIKGTFVREDIVGTKLIDLNSSPVTITARTVPQLSKIEIVDGVAGYEVGTVINVDGGGICKIESVDDSGKIKNVKVIASKVYPVLSSEASAQGYNAAPITSPTPTSITSGNVILLNGVGSYTSIFPHGLTKGNYANIYFESLPNISEKELSVKYVLDSKRFTFDYSAPEINPSIEIELKANIRYTQPANLFANINILKESTGYWLNNKGKLSELVYIHGPAVNSIDRSKLFYQPYSYVVKSDISIADWNKTTSQLVHPSGTEVFGEIDINKEISGNSEPTGQSEVWDYFGITSDSNVIIASTTLYTNSRVTNLKVTTDMIYVIFDYL